MIEQFATRPIEALRNSPKQSQSNSGKIGRQSSFFYWWAGLILLVYFGLALGDALTSVPWCDEAWLADPALTFLRHGYFGTPLLTPFGWGPPQYLPDIAHRTYWIMPLHMVMQVGWYKLFGFSLTSLRTLSIFWGAAALTATGAIARFLKFGTGVALLTMAVTGTDYFFLTRAADGRMDVMAAALMLISLASYLWQRNNNMTVAAALAGLCGAASSFTHPVGGLFVLCGLIILVIHLDRQRLRIRHALVFSLPFLLIGLAWLSYALQNLPSFRAQLAGNASGRWQGILSPLWSIHGELRVKYLQAFGLNDFSHWSLQYLRLGVLVAYLLSIVIVISNRRLRRQPGIRTLLWILLVFMMAGMVFDGAKRAYYLIYLLPFFGLVFAVAVNALRRSQSSFPVLLARALFAVVFVQTGGTVFRISQNEYSKEYLPAAEFLSARNPDHKLVFGSGELGFYLGFPDYLVDDVSLGYFSGATPELIFSEKTHWGLWLNDLRVRKPEVGKYIASTLAHKYRLLYDTKLYQIYQRIE